MCACFGNFQRALWIYRKSRFQLCVCKGKERKMLAGSSDNVVRRLVGRVPELRLTGERDEVMCQGFWTEGDG